MSSPVSLSAFGMPTPRGGSSSPGSARRGSVVGESGGGLFVVGEHDPTAVGIRILHIDPNDGGYCGGKIGKSGIKMCIRPIGACTIQAHRRFKAAVTILGGGSTAVKEGVFTDSKTPMTVYTTEVLPVDLLTKPFELYASDLRPPAQWGAYFRALAKRPREIDAGDLETMSQAHEEMLDSPYKKRREMDLEHGVGDEGSGPSAIDLKLANLANLIGKQADGSSTESILAQLTRLEELVEKGCLAENHATAVDQLMTTYGVDLAGLKDSASDQARQKLQEELAPMVAWFLRWTKRQTDGTLGPIGEALDRQLEALDRKVQELSGAIPPSTPRVQAPYTPLFGGVAATPRPLAQPALDSTAVENRLRLLQEKVDALQEQVAGEAVTIAGVSFKSKNELRSWLRLNMFDNDMFMCFADPSAVLNMASRPCGDNESVMNFHSAARKAGLGAGYVGLAQLSFSFTLPVVFIHEPGVKTATSAMKDSRILPRAKTATDWDDGSLYGSVKQRILNEVEIVKQMLDSTLSSTTQLTPEGQRVASTCINQSMIFINNLVTWMSTTYYGGLADGQLGPPLWGYISHCVRALFKSLQAARISGQKPNPDAADCVWGYFQGLKLANEVNAAGFSGHQVLSHVLNLHLQDQAVMKDALDEKLKTLEKRMDTAAAEAKRLSDALEVKLNGVLSVAKGAQAAASKRAGGKP